MKRLSLIFTLLIIFSLSACTLPAPGGGSQQAGTATATSAAQNMDVPTATRPAAGAPAGEQGQPAPTATQPPAVTSTAPVVAQPDTAPTATTQAEVGAGQDAATAPTKTAAPLIKFDPNVSLGNPKYLNNFEVAYLDEWAPPETKKLPDNSTIRLQFKDGKLYVTGKQREFSTWWFSYHNLKDFFVEMTFDTETCSGSDTYGIILRGPAHLAGVSYGYVVAFTCDGHYWVFRLDGIDPWQAKELVDETKSDIINTGSDKLNVIGVRANGETLTIYGNGYQLAQVKDNKYSQGRLGVFVRAVNTSNYTFRLTRLAYWILNTPK